MSQNALDGIIDFVQQVLVIIVIFIVTLSILSLILFDFLAGTGVMMYLTGDNLWASVLISLATSGLLISLVFLSDSSVQKNMGLGKKEMLFLGLITLLTNGLDIYFDSLTADYLRFGKIISLNTLATGDIHLLFRVLIGGISAVGEKLAIGILLGMPILKKILSGALPKQKQKTTKRGTKNESNKNKISYRNKKERQSQDGLTQERYDRAVKNRKKKQQYRNEPTYHSVR